MVTFFHHIYIKEARLATPYSIKGFFPTIDPSMMESLGKSVTFQEVTDSLFSMGPLKDAGVNGLHAQFYQA